MIHGHGGNIYEWAKKLNCSIDEIIDMSSNINPLGSPPGLLEFIKDRLKQVHCLPEVDSKALTRTFALFFDKHEDQVVCGSGTTEFIYLLPQILQSKNALIIAPTYADYADSCVRHGIQFHVRMTKASKKFQPALSNQNLDGIDTVFICNPNNPSGHFIPYVQLKAWCKSYPEIRFIIDESYLQFSPEYEFETMIRSSLPNVIVLCSFSKIHAIPGLRLGFIVAKPDTVKSFKNLDKPWHINTIAQISGAYIFNNMLTVHDHIEKTIHHIQTERNRFEDTLAHFPDVKTFSSFAPYILIELPDHLDGSTVCSQLAEKRILIRNCSNFNGLSNQFIRIAYKQSSENKQVLEYLKKMLTT
jgi:threonine-phosphate decarboxylase